MIDPLIFPLSHEFAIREVVENLSVSGPVGRGPSPT